MAALGTFTLRIDATRPGPGGPVAETMGNLRIKFQNGSVINDDDADKFWTLPLPAGGSAVSLPYEIDLPTDVTEGESVAIGYEVTFTTRNGSRVDTEFAAQAAGATVNLDDVTPVTALSNSV